MKITKKFLKNISKIMNITGFYITAKGDPSVGINESQWKLEEDFYFDNQEELEEFKNELKKFFNYFYGEGISVETYEEYQKQIDAEDIEYFKQFPVRYLIRDRDYGLDTFKQANFCASYSSNVGTGIHAELPKWIPEEGDIDTKVIKSTDPEYKEILIKETNRLENEISNTEYRLNIAKANLRIIIKELNVGLKIKKDG
jgi:hypothetical protein